MLEYLIQLPCEIIGQNMLGFLELIDIIQFENAAASHKSQQLLRAILPYSPPIRIQDSNPSKPFYLRHLSCDWFIKRRYRIQQVKISIDVFREVVNPNFVLDNIELFLNKTISLEKQEYLKNPSISQCVNYIKIFDFQDPAAIEVLFYLLLTCVRSLYIQSPNLTQWMRHIKLIGSCLLDILIDECCIQSTIIRTITEYCPYLEKLSFHNKSGSERLFVQSITTNCPHLRSLEIHLSYSSSSEADADLSAFSEKCPQLEELSLTCPQLTDQSVIALAQHCSRLKKLQLEGCKLTEFSLIALSERGLPLEELDVFPRILISSAEIAVQCAHALSRIRELSTNNEADIIDQLLYPIPYMTGLCELKLDSSEDHLLVPHLLLLLQGQCCACLESLTIGLNCSIFLSQLSELATKCPQLRTICTHKPTYFADAVLVELARSCPYLQKVTLYTSGLTEEGVMALAVHCRQLQDLYIPNTTLTKKTVRQLVQHCRRLTLLRVRVYERESNDLIPVAHYKHFSSKNIRALRETVRQGDRESSRVEVITHRSNNSTCLIL